MLWGWRVSGWCWRECGMWDGGMESHAVGAWEESGGVGAACSILTFAQVGCIVRAVFDKEKETPRVLCKARGVVQGGGIGLAGGLCHRAHPPSS